MSVKLCFAAYIRVLKLCSIAKTTQKTICGAVCKTVEPFYGEMIATDDSSVSRILSCEHNLSPQNVVEPAKAADPAAVTLAMGQYVLPLLDTEKLPLALLALQAMALESVIENETAIGRMKRGELALKTTFNPAEFLADIFLYVAVQVPNKSGKATIKNVTKAYVDGFLPSRSNITIETNHVVESLELPRTLDIADFEGVFREVQHDAQLACTNPSAVKLFCLDISDSAFDYSGLSEYLLNNVGMYVYSRTQVKAFEKKNQIQSIALRAVRLMNAHGQADEKGTGNELGEMLLYAFMENGLHAPKLMSKVEIASSSGQYRSKSDAVHIVKRSINGTPGYQLVFGSSHIAGDIRASINNVFSTIKSIKQGRSSERSMVEQSLFNHTFDAETTEQLKQILIPSKARQTAPDMAFGVFIGYSLSATSDDNDAFRTLAMKTMVDDIQSVIPLIMDKVQELNLGMHSFYFYFLPFNDAEADKKTIMDELLNGGAM